MTVATTVISFSPPLKWELGGMPAGDQYGPIYWLPSSARTRGVEDRPEEAFTEVDIGVLVTTAQGDTFISTNGIGYFMHSNLDSLGREKLGPLEGHFERLTLSQRLGTG